GPAAKYRGEEVGEAAFAKQIVQVLRAAAGAPGAGPAGPRPLAEVEAAARPARPLPFLVARAELVVLGPLLRVAQHLVSFVELLEFVFCRFVARVLIGVIQVRQLAVGRLELLLGRIPLA